MAPINDGRPRVTTCGVHCAFTLSPGPAAGGTFIRCNSSSSQAPHPHVAKGMAPRLTTADMCPPCRDLAGGLLSSFIDLANFQASWLDYSPRSVLP